MWWWHRFFFTNDTELWLDTETLFIKLITLTYMDHFFFSTKFESINLKWWMTMVIYFSPCLSYCHLIIRHDLSTWRHHLSPFLHVFWYSTFVIPEDTFCSRVRFLSLIKYIWNKYFFIFIKTLFIFLHLRPKKLIGSLGLIKFFPSIETFFNKRYYYIVRN